MLILTITLVLVLDGGGEGTPDIAAGVMEAVLHRAGHYIVILLVVYLLGGLH
jgi:hypothetical protein